MSEPTHVAAAIVEAMREIKARILVGEDVTAGEFDQLLREHDELVAKFYQLPAHERDEALCR